MPKTLPLRNMNDTKKEMRMRMQGVIFAGALVCALSACGGGGSGDSGSSSTTGSIPGSSPPTPSPQPSALPDIAGTWQLAALPPSDLTRPPPTVPLLNISADGTFVLDVEGYVWDGSNLASEKRFACRFSGRFETQPQYDTRLHGRNLVIEDRGGESPCPRDFINTALGDLFAAGQLRIALGSNATYDPSSAWFSLNPDGTTTANFSFSLKRLAT